MGRLQAQQPLLGSRSRMARRAPGDPGRQQALCPPRRFARLSGRASLVGTRPGRVRRLGHRSSTSLHPFAPPALPGFRATLGALTPGRPALRSPRAQEHRLEKRPGLPASCHRIVRSFRLQPLAVVPTRLWGFLCRAYRTRSLGSPLMRGRASFGLRHWLGGSPRRPAESSSLTLRTNRSPPVALHPASRRRSDHRLRDARASRQGLSPC